MTSCKSKLVLVDVVVPEFGLDKPGGRVVGGVGKDAGKDEEIEEEIVTLLVVGKH